MASKNNLQIGKSKLYSKSESTKKEDDSMESSKLNLTDRRDIKEDKSIDTSSNSDNMEKSDVENLMNLKENANDILSINFNQIKKFSVFDPIVQKILDEIRDERENIPNDKCHKCKESLVTFSNKRNIKEYEKHQVDENIQTINDLDQALCQTLSCYNRKLYHSNVVQTYNQLSVSLFTSSKCEIDAWKRRLKDLLPLQINIIRSTLKDLKETLTATNMRISELRAKLTNGHLDECFELLNNYALLQNAQYSRAIDDCWLTFRKLAEYHSAVQETGRIFSDSYAQTVGNIKTESDFVDEYLNRIKNLRSSYFIDNKEIHFSNWFKTSRTNLMFKTIIDQLIGDINREDNSSQRKTKVTAHHPHQRYSRRSK